ncbi:MAG: PIG-L family deacetylase, partial [Longimicrobiales bacterium]
MPNRIVGVALVVTLVLGGVLRPRVPLEGQEHAFTRGTTGVGLILRKLDGVKRVLVVGAHPDDEDTSLIAALSRGMGAQVAYLSLSRGEGGQNLIGEEMDEGLGILRSGELLAARSLDGGVQYFARAFDFGYSKTAEETLSFWPREEILEDVTWVVRTFRPQVMVSVFSGTEGDGHGHHQVAGMLAREAFHTAADPSAFPEQLAAGGVPWAPVKLFRLARFGPGDITTEVETGSFDPLLGRSHHQLAMESRSQHRSQDMGRPQPMGPRSSRLSLLESRLEDGVGGEGLFAGVDTTLPGLAKELDDPGRERVGEALRSYRNALALARSELDALAPWSVTPYLQDALRALRRARQAADPGGPPELMRVLDARIPLVEEAVFRSAGIVMDVRVQDDLLVPGEDVELEVEVWNGGPFSLSDPRVELELPAGWRVGPLEGAAPEEGEAALPPGQVALWRYSVSLSEDAELSRPYFLEEEREGELYRWPVEPELWARAGNPPLAHGLLHARLPEGPELSLRREALYRGVDKAVGEYVERPLVVPALSVSVDPSIQIWPLDMAGSRELTVRVRNEAEAGRSGTVSLSLPDGWESVPAQQFYDFREAGTEASFSFSFHPPEHRSTGVRMVEAVARTEQGENFR